MTSGPRTLIEFQEMLPDEDACWAHLRAVRWPDGFECHACQHRESSWLSPRQGGVSKDPRPRAYYDISPKRTL